MFLPSWLFAAQLRVQSCLWFSEFYIPKLLLELLFALHICVSERLCMCVVQVALNIYLIYQIPSYSVICTFDLQLNEMLEEKVQPYIQDISNGVLSEPILLKPQNQDKKVSLSLSPCVCLSRFTFRLCMLDRIDSQISIWNVVLI